MSTETDRLAVAAAFREVCARRRVHYEGLATDIERWSAGLPPMVAFEWPGPPRDADTGYRRRQACVAAIEEARRRGLEIPQDIIMRMISWSWERLEDDA